MEESDKKAFLDDFKKGDIQQKLDMWFFAIEQVGIWEQVINEMSFIATDLSRPKKKIVKKE